MDDLENLKQKIKDKAVAVYGTRLNAEKLLSTSISNNIRCFVSTDQVGSTYHGYPVLSITEAIRLTEVIIIAAGFTATLIIYARIKDELPKSMMVFDCRGRQYGNKYINDDDYWNFNYNTLVEEIKRHDVISFDVFDTIIMRSVLEPKDIFYHVGMQTENPDRFVQDRILAEKKAALINDHYPNIDQIYNQLQIIRDWSIEDTEYFKRREWQEERKHIIPRKAIVSALQYAKKNGKKIYLISNMYYHSDSIRELLSGIKDIDKCNILVSCDYKCGKNDGLFKILKNREANKKILHIGDNEISDIKAAKDNNIDTFHIYSGFELFLRSNASEIAVELPNQIDRDILGRLISEKFNNPFALCNSRGVVSINKYRDIAWIIYPITAAYLSFIFEVSGKYDVILFASRDGYFLYKMYNKYLSKHHEACDDAKYFYTSRQSICSAAARDNEDIIKMCKLSSTSSITLKKAIEKTFHIETDGNMNMSMCEAYKKWGENTVINNILSYSDIILKKAKKLRCNYCKYIDDLNIIELSKIAIIDLSTVGTLPYGLSRILGKKIGLIAFNYSSFSYNFIDSKDVEAFCKNATIGISQLLEILYASTDGQVFEFDEEGRPIFLKNNYNKTLLNEVQNELESIFELCWDNKYTPSKEFSLNVLRFFMNNMDNMSEKIKKQFTSEDPCDPDCEGVFNALERYFGI